MFKDKLCQREKTHWKLLAGIFCAGAALSFGEPAIAQPTLPNVTATNSVNVNAPTAIQQFGKRLTDDGIYITALYSGQVAGNPSGGQKQGVAYAGRLSLGAAFDLQKIIGLEGGTLHVVFADDSGQSLAAHFVNTDLAQQSLYSGPEAFQLAIFTYEQKLFHNKVDINVGRTDLAFLNSDLYCDFESRGQCGRPSATVKSIAASLFPTAVWGGRILIAPTPHLYAKVGVYQPNADLRPGINDGFDFGIKTAGPTGGVDFPVEVGYTYTTPGAVIPNQYDIGMIDSEVKFSAPYYRAKTPTRDGRIDLYFQAQQLVYQAKAHTPRGIYLFSYGIYGASGGAQVAKYQLTAGAVWQGPFASRPFDRAGLTVNNYHFNTDYLNSLYATRLKAKGTDRPFNNQMLIEADYMIQLNKWLQFQPDFQYLIHPDGLGFAVYPTHNLPNAVIVGAQFNVNLATFVGLPSYPLSAQQDN